MRTVLSVVIFILALVVGLGADGWPVKDYRGALHAIIAGDNFCTAVKVGDNGILLSVAHCVEGDKPIVHVDTGRDVVLLERNETMDIVVLQMAIGGKPLKVAKKEPEMGDETLSLGFGNTDLTPLPGYWIGKVGGKEDPMTVLTVSAIHGMSGGPVVNRKGEIVGLVRGVVDTDSVNVTLLVTLKTVQEAVKRWVK